MKNFLGGHISLTLALRYLNPLRTFFSIITLICLIGVALGVMVLIVVLSVMGGLQKEIQGRLFAHSPHVQVSQVDQWGSRRPIENWQELADQLISVPGVKSSYALIEDYSLVDADGRHRPCFFRAIDTENTEQLGELKNLVKAGNAELDMGEKAVISSQMSESMHAGVGSTIRLYTTRNFQEVSNAYSQTELPLVSDKFTEELKVLKSSADKIKVLDKTESLSTDEMKNAANNLVTILNSKIRDKEREPLDKLYDVINESSLEGDQVVFPSGTKEMWGKSIETLLTQDKNAVDMDSFSQIKQFVLPKDLEVIGVYQSSQHTPSPDMFIPLGIGQELLGYQDDLVLGVALRVDDPYNVSTILPSLQAKLDSIAPEGVKYSLDTWMERFNSFFELMQKERTMMSFVLSFISLISAFCIMAVMFTVSIQRKKEIAVMKALGATPGQIVRVFLWQGVIIGFVGAILGIGLGLLVLHYRSQIQFGLSSIGFDPFPMSFHGTELPALIDWSEMIWQGIKAFIMVVIASIVPALITSRQDPAKALRGL